MNLIERVKNIITTPKTEWFVIESESTTPASLVTSYVLPLALIASLSSVLRGLLWSDLIPLNWWLLQAAASFIGSMIGFYIAFYVIDMLAPSFGSEKNINRSAQLVAYSYTASWIGGLFGFVPYIGWLVALAGGIYSIYTMFLGIGPMKKTPEDKKVAYLVVSILIMIIATAIVVSILRSIFFRIADYPNLRGYGFYY